MGFSGATGASRAERKAKKRQIENSIPDVPMDLEDEVEVEPEAVVEAAKKEKSSKRKRGAAEESNGKDKKNKKAKVEDVEEVDEDEEMADGGDANADGEAPRKSKKERKAERKAKEAAEKEALAKGGEKPKVKVQDGAGVDVKEGGNKGDKSVAVGGKDAATIAAEKAQKKKEKKQRQKDAAAAGEKTDSKAARFIVFIGNLPFTATTPSIQKHFAAVKPISIRHQTEKGSTKSKGYAFLEFEGYDHMKTCLKQFHHSTFDDKLSAPRKINVELTAGGGGNTKDRKTKILDKNTKLNEQRLRQAQEENDKSGKKSSTSNTTTKTSDPRSEVLAPDSGVHPSRRAVLSR